MAKVKSKSKPVVKAPKPINWRSVARTAKRLQVARVQKAAAAVAEQQRIADDEWIAREARYRLAGYAVARDGSIIRIRTGEVVGALNMRR